MKTIQATSMVLIFLAVMLGCKQKSGESQESGKKSSESSKPELVSQWSTDTVMRTPESVCYNPDGQVLYVSNIQGESDKKDGKGFISKLSPQGEVLALKWVTGLDAPKGMGVYQGKLYVTNIDEIVEIDIDQGKITQRYACPDARFANDIAVNQDGTVFASDMAANKIYRLKNGQVDVWLEGDPLKSPNGLYTTVDMLMIGIEGAVLKVPYQGGEPEPHIDNTGGIDGLEAVKKNYYIKSDWAGHVHLIHPEKPKQLILDTTPDNINAADIDFDSENMMLYVPTFHDNRVMAYKLKM